jgi:hypothetical protein
MPVYTVHQPPGAPSRDATRVMFVRDGFYFWAFLFGPLWLLFRRLWLVLVIYFAVMSAVHAALWLVKASAETHFWVTFAIAILLGLEASTLWRGTLRRRGWKDLGVVVGDDLEVAERRFFAQWQEAPAAVPERSGPPPRIPRNTTPDVLGLFPEAGARR